MNLPALHRRLTDRLFGRTTKYPSVSRSRHKCIRIERLEARQLMVADLIHFVTSEHVDVNVMHNGSEWSIGPRNTDAFPAIQYAHDEAVMYVGTPALTSRPGGANFDFIGVGAGESYYLLPQSQNSEVLYLGFATVGVNASTVDSYSPTTESKGRVNSNARWVKAALTDVRHTRPDGTLGNGVFSAWQTGSFGTTNVFISSYDDGIANPTPNGLDVTDGISADDAMWLVSGGHAHYNVGFSAVGRYEIDLRVSAFFGDNGSSTPNLAGFSQSEDITLYFSVASVGRLQFEESSYSVNEGSGTASIDVVRVGGSDGRLMVEYASDNGSALADEDYTAVTGTLEFLDGETRKTITIPIVDDTAEELDETFTVSLSNPAPENLDDYLIDFEGDLDGLLGTITTATVTIIDNDATSINQPPVVGNLFAYSTDWSNAFIDTLDGGGSDAGNGIGHDLSSRTPLPWNNVNRLHVQFSEHVLGVSAATIELRDSSGLLPIVVSYNPTTFAAIVEMQTQVTFGKLRLAISDTVTDEAGSALDGDANDQPGGIFNFRFDILAGDFDGSGRVNGADLTGFSSAFNAQAGQAAFLPRANWNGDDRVNGSDLSIFSTNFNLSLASLGEPGPPFGGSGQRSSLRSARNDTFFAHFGNDQEEDDRDDHDLHQPIEFFG